ncbi:MAG: DUF1830 domain-containing protein [Cyanobacteriota bacterium]|nr:DUF1830 domain-containing protein [Cyanobacteriota bacterium]
MSLATSTVQGVLLDCTYRNTTDRMVILRCCGSNEFFLERVVFPFELLAFACPSLSEVKIWSHGLYGPELLESFSAEQLLAEQAPQASQPAPDGMFPSNSSALNTTPWLQAS